MNTAFKPSSWALLLSLVAGIAAAQDSTPLSPPPAPGVAPTGTAPSPAAPSPQGSGGRSAKTAAKSSAQIDAGEPQANTSSTSTDNASAAAGGEPAPAAAAAPVAGARATARTGSAARSPAVAGQKAGAQDRLDLGTATVTGDREQPKVMYIVPWKRSDIGDSSGKPMNSLLDEALAPVDRDEFKREVAYYDAVNADTSQNGARSPAKQGEK